MAYKLDIKQTLRAIDLNDLGYLDRQTEEARKAFAPLVVQRWASVAGSRASAEDMLIRVNERSNRHLFDLAQHPELQFRLLASAGTGRVLTHGWLAGPKSRRTSNKVLSFLAKYWPDANDDELGLILSQFTKPTFRQFVETSGIDPKEFKGLIDAFTRSLASKEGSSGA